jgi:Type II secretion system (T2SS), protein M subtype b
MTPRDRKVIVLGSSVVLAAVLALRVVPWSAKHALAAHADLRERATLLARARDEVARAHLLRDSTEVLTRALVALAPKLLDGRTVAEATVDLSGRLNLAASRSPAKLERLDQLDDSTTSGRLARVRVRAALETDIRGMLAFLRAVDGGDAVLSVSDLRVVAPDPGSPDRAPEILKVEVTVSGWYLKGQDSRSRKGDG